MKISYETASQRLAALDAQGRRIGIFPAKVRGWFRPRRTAFEAFLMAIFLGLPLLEIGGKPAVFLDVGRREFHLFGLELWATDAPLALFVVAAFFCLLMAVSALWGRVWCGWACPQTVVIDLLYRRIEEWIEGDSHERRKLMAAPWAAGKVAKRTFKWVAYVVLSVFLAHAFLAFFVSWKGFGELYATGFADAAATRVMVILSSIVFLVDFGWFREMFCIVACPYGRWQSVWMDEDSMVVGYDVKRGEPRRGLAQLGQSVGDCVNCYRCVQCCPTGIDVRRGNQMECVACTACIDACDEVMEALGKPKGLIRYTSQAAAKGAQSLSEGFRIRWRARPLAYLAIFAVLGGGLTYNLLYRSPVSVTVLRAPGPPYLSQPLADGRLEVLNSWQIAVRNQLHEPIRVDISVVGQAQGLVAVSGDAVGQVFAPGEHRRLRVLGKREFPGSHRFGGSLDVELRLDVEGQVSRKGARIEKTARFIAP